MNLEQRIERLFGQPSPTNHAKPPASNTIPKPPHPMPRCPHCWKLLPMMPDPGLPERRRDRKAEKFDAMMHDWLHRNGAKWAETILGEGTQ